MPEEKGRYLHGFHDEGGESLHRGKPGWTIISEEVGLNVNAQGRDYSHIASQGIGVLVRLNYSHGGEGTIPLKERYRQFAIACMSFVRSSRGVWGWIIGNEPNLENERPKNAQGQRVIIMPEDYADCFLFVRDGILTVAPGAILIPAPVAPYNADPMDCMEFARRANTKIALNGGCGAIAIHAYTRGMSPDNIRSVAQMGAPLQGQYSGFWTFIDYLEKAIPLALTGLPAFITEFDVYGPWENRATGVINEAYKMVDDWNKSVRQDGRITQKIWGMMCFRWLAGLNDVDWGMSNKPALLEDFKYAVSQGYTLPASKPAPIPVDANTIFIPSVKGGDQPAPTPAPIPRDISQDYRDRTKDGIALNQEGQPGYVVFDLIVADYSENAAREWGPDHHILVDVLDEAGNRIQGQEVTFRPGNETPVVKKIDKGSGTPYGVDFDLYAAGYGYGCFVGRDDSKSDLAFNMGLGKIATPYQGDHVSYKLTFKRSKVTEASAPTPSTPSQPSTGPLPGGSIPALQHPIPDPANRIITQRFGARPEVYEHFSFDGVPLKGHEGMDFGAPLGSPVMAADLGLVLEAGNMGDQGYGLYIKLAHPQWHGETVYGHLADQRVKVGDTVQRGQRIGTVGYSGNVEPKSPLGAHLHFGLRIEPYNRQDGWGGYSNPEPYLAGSQTAPSSPGGPVDAQSKEAIVKTIKAAANEFNVSYPLLLSLIHAESSLDPSAENKASGAKGLGQIMPGTWGEWAKPLQASNIFDAKDNARVTAAYLGWCIANTQSQRQALWAYNWGWGNVQKYFEGGQGARAIPNETKEYASKVIHGKEVIEFALLAEGLVQ